MLQWEWPSRLKLLTVLFMILTLSLLFTIFCVARSGSDILGLMARLLVLVLLGLDPALLIVSFAPIGVEAMVVIAAELGLSPAFVAGHHVWRLIVLG
ncbi:MAG: hypothetical protein HOI47_08550, partial [Candidatus Scalindua sp.]|nr:hypothetical protein [Candidatus Scalindua sp.]